MQISGGVRGCCGYNKIDSRINRQSIYQCFRRVVTGEFSPGQFGTQVKFRLSRDHNNQTEEKALSALWYFPEMELEPVAG